MKKSSVYAAAKKEKARSALYLLLDQEKRHVSEPNNSSIDDLESVGYKERYRKLHGLIIKMIKPMESLIERTPIELSKERKHFMKLYKPHFGVIEEFTCDGCAAAPTCPYVFDAYNIGGDCLASK